MALRYGERQQRMLFPESLEDYVPQDDPVRVYDAFVDALDWNTVGIDSNPKKAGCPQYDPKTMLKILLYAYSYGGVRSSRKLERALHHNVTFMWLAGGLKPDFKTIARYRRKNKKAFKQVLKQCVQLCIKLGVIAGHTLFVDGSKVRANAGRSKCLTQEHCQALLDKLDRRIDKLLSECEQTDQKENGQGSLVKLQDELADQEALKSKIEATLKLMKEEGVKRYNTTDPDCGHLHSRQGTHAAYNQQNVVDDQHGLIVNTDVINANNDLNQFSNQISQANGNLNKPCQNAVADAGYSSANDLAVIEKQGINVIVPTTEQAGRKKPTGPFDKSQFQYLPEEDCYICPEGKRLPQRSCHRARKALTYSAGYGVCKDCRHFGICTKNKTNGREIQRYDVEEIREKIAARYEDPFYKKVFAQRKCKVELPFGHMKHNLGVSGFLLRGFEGVQAEASLLCNCFNIARLIGIFGASTLIAKLGNL